MSFLKPSPAIRQALVWVFSNVVAVLVLLGIIHPDHANTVTMWLVDGSFATLMILTTYKYLHSLHLTEMFHLKKHHKEEEDTHGRG